MQEITIKLNEEEAKVLLGILDNAINETGSAIVDELASGIYFRVKQEELKAKKLDICNKLDNAREAQDEQAWTEYYKQYEKVIKEYNLANGR